MRIRPFNMANFSGAGGYIPIFVMFGSFVSFPATLLLWTGFAVSLENIDGTYDYSILKLRLKRVLLPICIVSLIIWAYLFLNQLFSYGGSSLAWLFIIVWGVGVHSIGMYISISCSAKILNKKGKLTKGKWFLLTLAFAVLLAIIGVMVSLPLLYLAS